MHRGRTLPDSAFPVFQPDAVQTIGDQRLPIADGGAAGIQNGLRQIPGGIERGFGAKLGAEARCQPVQLTGSAQHEPVLQAGRGAFAQNGRRLLEGEVDLRQLCGVLHKRAQRQLRTGQDHPAHKLLLCIHCHHGNGSICRDDHQRPGTLCQRRHSPAQQLCPQLRRIVQLQPDAAFQSGPHSQDACFAQQTKRGQHPPADRRDHTAQNAALDLCRGCAVQRKQADQPDGVFVDGGSRVGVELPAEAERILLVPTNGNVGVADVDGKDHGQGPLSQRFIMYNTIIAHPPPVRKGRRMCKAPLSMELSSRSDDGEECSG